MTSAEFIARWRAADDRKLLLQVVQPGLIGLIDGTISTLAPIFAAAYLGGSREALLVGLAAALGAAISMGLSEGLSDDGTLTGRGTQPRPRADHRRATFVGRHAPRAAVPDRRPQEGAAVAYAVVAVELVVIAWVRRRFLEVSLTRSLSRSRSAASSSPPSA